MGLTGALIVILIFIVVLAYAGTWIMTTFVNLTEASKGYLDAYNIKIAPNKNENVCTLSITVFGELQGKSLIGIPDNLNPLPANLFIKLGQGTSHPEIARYNWIDCHPATAYPIASLISGGFDNAQLAALFITEETIHAEIVLRSADGKKLDAHSQPSMAKALKIPAGSVSLPYSLAVKYVVTNVPQRDYDLDIYYGRPINDMGAGQPFTYHVVK